MDEQTEARIMGYRERLGEIVVGRDKWGEVRFCPDKLCDDEVMRLAELLFAPRRISLWPGIRHPVRLPSGDGWLIDAEMEVMHSYYNVERQGDVSMEIVATVRMRTASDPVFLRRVEGEEHRIATRAEIDQHIRDNGIVTEPLWDAVPSGVEYDFADPPRLSSTPVLDAFSPGRREPTGEEIRRAIDLIEGNDPIRMLSGQTQWFVDREEAFREACLLMEPIDWPRDVASEPMYRFPEGTTVPSAHAMSLAARIIDRRMWASPAELERAYVEFFGAYRLARDLERWRRGDGPFVTRGCTDVRSDRPGASDTGPSCPEAGK